MPEDPVENTVYTVWATLKKVAVEGDTPITDFGYETIDALPIGTYIISVNKTDMEAPESQFYIGKADGDTNVNFIYLKTDNAPVSYTYDRFPENVHNVSQTAPDSTGDGTYLIKNGGTDNAWKNIADSNRKKDGDNQTLTFNFGTVDKRTINGTDLSNTKGYSRLSEDGEDYAKDRLGIILLSVDPNSLAISKTVTNTNKETEHYKTDHYWQFEITFKPDSAADNIADFEAKNKADVGEGFDLKWYKFSDGKWEPDDSSHIGLTSIKFEGPNGDGKYTTKLNLKHNEKVVITGLQEGTWQVTETDERENTVGGGAGIFYSAHNNMDDKEDHEFSNMTKDNIQLNPASHVDFENVFPYELPSTGDIGTDDYIFLGTMITIASILFVAKLWYNRRKRRVIHE